MTLYQLRIIERLWGSRKLAVSSAISKQSQDPALMSPLSFLILIFPLLALLPPLLLALVLRPLTFSTANYLPAGPTPILFALLAQYHEAIPQVYKYRIAAGHENFLSLTDKTATYVPALHVALAGLPGSAVAAAVGWLVGLAYRNEVLPGVMTRWRLPERLLNKDARGRNGTGSTPEGYESLRRRMQEESQPEGRASSREERAEGRRRTLGGIVLDQFRGRF